MIELYGKTYAKNDSELVESLFTPGGTCNGLYKKTARGIFLYSMQGELRAFVRRDGLGPVTATKTERSGRVRYMFATSTADDSWLGTPDSYREACEQARNLALTVFPPK